MRIAIDLDGVVFNSDMFFMAMGEIYDCGILGQNSIVRPDEARVQEKYNWNDEQIKEYIQKYSCTEEFEIMPCAKQVISFIKQMGHEVYFVSARGQFSQQEVIIAKEKLESAGICADKYFWDCGDKKKICEEQKIDVIIDDRYEVHSALADKDIICIYFRMAGKKQAKQRDNLYTVNNWGEIYRFFMDLQNK